MARCASKALIAVCIVSVGHKVARRTTATSVSTPALPSLQPASQPGVARSLMKSFHSRLLRRQHLSNDKESDKSGLLHAPYQLKSQARWLCIITKRMTIIACILVHRRLNWHSAQHRDYTSVPSIANSFLGSNSSCQLSASETVGSAKRSSTAPAC
jgi:hypothetical protein